GTKLRETLARMQPRRVLVTGWATDFCVDATVRSTVSHGRVSELVENQEWRYLRLEHSSSQTGGQQPPMETTPISTNTANVLTGEGWRDSIEALVRDRIRGLIEEILEEELSDALGRARYVRCKTDPGVAVDISQGLGDEGTASAARVAGHRHGRRER